MKSIILDSLAADPRFSGVQKEKNWRSLWDPSAFRRPDVQATYRGLRIAFEIQLSTTFIDVIAARRAFYLAEGGLLFWIFKEVDPGDRRLTVDDVFIPNNHNLFVANDETLRLSREAGKLTLKCHYRVPRLVGSEIVEDWHAQFVTVDQLTLDVEHQRVYFLDYAAVRATVDAHAKSAGDELRDRFQAFWERFDGRRDNEGVFFPDVKVQRDYQSLRDALNRMGFNLPRYHTERNFVATMRLCYSAKLGRPIGFRLKSLNQVAHRAYDGYKPLLHAFISLTDVYGHRPALEKADQTGKWRERRAEAESAWSTDRFRPDDRYADLLAFLFPEAKQCFA